MSVNIGEQFVSPQNLHKASEMTRSRINQDGTKSLLKKEALKDSTQTLHDEEYVVKEEMEELQPQDPRPSLHTAQEQSSVGERHGAAAVTAEECTDSHTRVELPGTTPAPADVEVQEQCLPAVKEEVHSDPEAPPQMLDEGCVVKVEIDIGPIELLPSTPTSPSQSTEVSSARPVKRRRGTGTRLSESTARVRKSSHVREMELAAMRLKRMRERCKQAKQRLKLQTQLHELQIKNLLLKKTLLEYD